jgi:hypothetical protein
MKVIETAFTQPEICPAETRLKESQGYDSDVYCPYGGTGCSIAARRILGVTVKTEVLACELQVENQQVPGFDDGLGI